MLKSSLVVLVVAAALIACGRLTEARSADAAGPTGTPAKFRVGTYDNRAIAIAYAGSSYNEVSVKMAEFERAKEAGDTKRVEELEAWGQKRQRQLHRQGFARVPVDDLLAAVKDELPAVARAANVDVIAWTCDYHTPDVEVVDVTMELVALFDPSERALGWVKGLKDVAPLDLDEVERHQDDH